VLTREPDVALRCGDLEFSDGEQTYSLADLCKVTGPLGLDAESLAAALNVPLAQLEGWVAGEEMPPAKIIGQLRRGVAANTVDVAVLGSAWANKPIIAPRRPWVPVFRPQGRFRLPLNVEWSGTADTRWRNADEQRSVDWAYELVIHEGGAGDIVRWIDPMHLVSRLRPARTGSEGLPEIPPVFLDRYRRELWPKHLLELGYPKV